MTTPADVARALTDVLEPHAGAAHVAAIFGAVRRRLNAEYLDCPPLGEVKRAMRSAGLRTHTDYCGPQVVPGVRIARQWKQPHRPNP